MEEERSPWELEQNEEDLVLYHTEDIDFELEHQNILSAWVKDTISIESKHLQQINFIFCSDAYLHNLNLQYLQHDTLTDIITFPYLELPLIEGDIFISIDRVRENARAYGSTFEQELYRVMIHGVLHLCGYTDKTAAEKAEMTKQENQGLERLSLLS